MAEIYMNLDDLESTIRSFSKQNNTFVLRSFRGNDQKKRCHCFIAGKECKIDFHLKKNNAIRILPVGNNIKESSYLIDHIVAQGLDAKTKVKQFTFPCNKNIVDSLKIYVNEELINIISIDQDKKNDNLYRFTGYHNDVLTFTFYPSTDKAMIQGRPLQVYNIIVTYLSTITDISFDTIVNINNAFNNTTLTSDFIRNEIKNKLGSIYHYLDEALLKSLSGSFSSLKQITRSEDYTGCLVGVFKTLEGYLSKVLTQKYAYRMEKHHKFSMFYKCQGAPSNIDNDSNIEQDCKKHLINLYNFYSDKRNVYLHATTDPAQTRIIPSLQEAQDLADDILNEISKSYDAIFKNYE